MSRLMTQEGLKKLEDELEERKSSIRHEIANAIKEAKEQGDLSENAEYSTAKQRQAENEARIAELERMIKDAEVVKKKSNSSTVGLGSNVSVKTKAGEMTFEIVSANEVEPQNFKISNESPLGKAFMGKKKGDKVDVETPGGSMNYEITNVA